MKKILNILLLFILSLTIVACNNKTIDQDSKPNEEENQEENNDQNLPITDENLGFAIHYDITTKTMVIILGIYGYGKTQKMVLIISLQKQIVMA